MKRNRPIGFLALCLLLAPNASAAIRYVDVNNASPMAPYNSWATAATSIQDAVDAAVAGDQILVTNGVYKTGGRIVSTEVGGTNRVAVTKAVAIQSVNGPAVTVIQGYRVPATTNGPGAIRCVYLTNDASLSGFTLTNGATWSGVDYRGCGGGVWCESTNAVVTNCVLVGNACDWAGGGAFDGTLNNCLLLENVSTYSYGYGGGADGGRSNGGVLNNCVLSGNVAYHHGGGASWAALNNCILSNNWARADGGGADHCNLNNCLIVSNSCVNMGGGVVSSTLRNCTLIGNAARSGSGTASSSLANCIVFFNTAANPTNFTFDQMNYCCTTPLPTNGVGNITNAPLFVDPANGNFRLQSNSPCINAGFNPSVIGSTDLDGGLRIAGGTVDLGAYEFQTPASLLSYAWAQQYGLPTDGSADFADSDTDRMNNWQEWIAGTIPTNALSVLKLLSPQPQPDGTVVSWQSVAGKSYLLERATDLGAAPVFSTVSSNILGRPGTTSFTDTNTTGSGPVFYRVGVK